MSTITEVARIAGVSVATVSRVINKSGTVAEETCQRVMLAVEQTGYNPNEAARNLRTSKSNVILVILPSITNTFFSKVVRGIEETGRKNGYNVLLCTTGGDAERERLYLKMISSRQADGVIFMDSSLEGEELRNFHLNYPCVFCSEYVEKTGIPYVSVDNFHAAYEMTEYIISKGHKRIALISADGTVSAKLRTDGYLKALKDNNISENFTYYGNYSYNSGYDAAKRIIAENNGITAVFAVSDIMAMGVCRAYSDSGISVPENVVIAGFDNILFSRIFSPELTTIAQPRYQLGENAFLLLLGQLRSGNKSQNNIIVEHTLIKRVSTEGE